MFLFCFCFAIPFTTIIFCYSQLLFTMKMVRMDAFHVYVYVCI